MNSFLSACYLMCINKNMFSLLPCVDLLLSTWSNGIIINFTNIPSTKKYNDKLAICVIYAQIENLSKMLHHTQKVD